MRHQKMTIRQTITTPTIKGIFFNLADSEEFEFINDDNKLTLNVDYYEIRSRDKIASPMYQDMIDGSYVFIDDGVLVDCDGNLVDIDTSVDDILSMQSSIIINRYKDKWLRIYNALVEAEYEPLENYNMTQTETPNVTNTRTTKTKTKLTTTDSTDRYGFNSTNPSPYQKDVTSVEGTDTDNQISDTNVESGTRSLTRRGNIGVTTSQQMLESEIKLRALYNMVNIIYDDVDKVITIPLYR